MILILERKRKKDQHIYNSMLAKRNQSKQSLIKDVLTILNFYLSDNII